ncbi:hypothetical protein DSECCO2_622760 [anaerobic digester metagenome]
MVPGRGWYKMDIWEAKVSCYNKTQRGKTSLQCEIRLNKGHPFTKGEEVVVAGIDDFKQQEKEIRELQEEVKRLNEANVKLTLDSNDTLRKLTVASQVVNQYKEVMKTQETLLAIYTNRGLLGRLMNKKPQELEELTEDKDKLKRLEDSTPLILELTNPAGEDEK